MLKVGGKFIVLHLVSEGGRTIYKAFLSVSEVGRGSIIYATWCQRWEGVYKIFHLVSEVEGNTIRISHLISEVGRHTIEYSTWYQRWEEVL